jgi:retron-type reverse transcriptase
VHKGIEKFKSFSLQVSKNNTRECFVLKCDIRKFFANIDHNILKRILKNNIQDTDILNLLGTIIDSFKAKQKASFTNSNPWDWNGKNQKGLPLGNLTSQLLVNVYMNEFDQFVKHKLKVKYYIRYADDFVFILEDKKWSGNLLPQIDVFLKEKLKLSLHPNKVFIQTLSSGVDFLGWVHFSHHRVIRTSTKKRMFRNLKGNNYKEESMNSYLGMLSHGNAHKLQEQVSQK